jgi:hypothetical protein
MRTSGFISRGMIACAHGVVGWAGTTTIELKPSKSSANAVTADVSVPSWFADTVNLIIDLISDLAAIADGTFGK